VVCVDYSATALVESSPPYRCNKPQRDENGIPILPGYRPPFKKGAFDPRRFVPQKGVRPKHLYGSTPNLLAATRRAFRKHALATAAATDPDLAMRHAKVCKLFFEIERELTGNRHHHKSSKPHSIPSAPSSFPMPDSGNNSTIQSASPPNQDASGVKPEAINPAVSPVIHQTEPLPDQA
jgi:hypothetical protein